VYVEISDPSLLPELRLFLQAHGCPSIPSGDDRCEVRVFRAGDEPRDDSEDRVTVFRYLREWCAGHPGVKANLLADS
jgi:hypothetical protein